MSNCSVTEIDRAIVAYNANNDFYLETHLSLALSMLFLVLFAWQVYRVSMDIYKWKTGKKERSIWKLIYIPILIATFLGFVRCLIRGVLFDRFDPRVRGASIASFTLVNISYIFIFLSFVFVVSIWTDVVFTNLRMNDTLGAFTSTWVELVVTLTFAIPVTITTIGGTIWRFTESMISLKGGRSVTNLATLKVWCGIIMFWSILLTLYCLIIGIILMIYVLRLKDKTVVQRITRKLVVRTFGVCSGLLTKSITFGIQIFLARVVSRWIVYLFVFGPELLTLYWACEIVYSTGRSIKKA